MKHFRDLGDEARAHLLQCPAMTMCWPRQGSESCFSRSRAHVPTSKCCGFNARTAVATLGPDPRPYLIGFPKLLRNLPVLERAATGRGLFSIVTEKDGIVRRVPVVMKANDETGAALAVDMLRVASGAQAMLVRSDASGFKAWRCQGLNCQPMQWSNMGPFQPTRSIEIHIRQDLIDGNVSAEKIAGKLVIIGLLPSVFWISRRRRSTRQCRGSRSMPKSLRRRSPTPCSRLQAYHLCLKSSAPRSRPCCSWPCADCQSIHAVSHGDSCSRDICGHVVVLYAQYQILLDPTFPLIMTLMIYIGLTLIGYIQEEADRKRIRSMFAQYLSPAWSSSSRGSHQKLKLGGEVRDMTILFSDVRGFTAVSETFANDRRGSLVDEPPADAADQCHTARRGTIDKYMGDAVMAFWNAPIENQFHEKDACMRRSICSMV